MERSVFVLGVLHDFHQTLAGYTYWHLLKLLSAYSPDLITIEVGERQFAAGDFRQDSPEKWGIALPWGLQHGVPVVATDGGGKQGIDYDAENERAMAELLARPGAKEAIAEFERQFSERFKPDLMQAYIGLTDTYEKANGDETQGVFRWTHAASAAVYGEGILTDFWGERNASMARRTVAAMERLGARRAIVTVGCEHKYALDDLFRDQHGLRVLQLADFLREPVTLTIEERAAFARRETPIAYPSDLMFVHRKLHGGEPNSYKLELPADSDTLDLDGVAERIDRALDADPTDADMLYYRGLLNYARREYLRAAEDFVQAATDRSRCVAGRHPLWQLATLRAGQMLDMLGEREAACVRYRTVASEGMRWLQSQAAALLDRPFARP